MKNTSFIFLVFLSYVSFSQMTKKEAKENNTKGENLIHSQYYFEALPIYQEIIKSFPDDKDYQYHLAICQTHTKDYKKQGLDLLINLGKQYGEENFRDFAFHAAHAYYYNHLHNESKIYFDKYKSHIAGSKNANLKEYVDLQAKYNENAIEMYHSYDSSKINVSNLNSPINSEFNEYCPYVSPDESAIYFTYTGPNCVGGKQSPTHKPDEKHGRYFEDIMVSYRNEDGSWGKPENLSTINTDENESCIGISQTGEYIFIYKSNKMTNGDLYFSKNYKGAWGKPIPFEGEVNSTSWEGAITMSNDGQTIYFASDRPGGFGGKDLYSAKSIGFNKWGNVKNLGSSINSKYDEDAPYLLPDGITLYFSSNGPKSMGGFDVFYSKFENDTWGEIVNAGVPLNSIKDERFYSVTADGQSGYFSRTNEHSLHEDQDLYDINPGIIGEKPKLALISGKVYLDNTNEHATIILKDAETGKTLGKFETNPKTSLFSMMVNPNKKYIIDVMVDEKKQYSDSLDTDFIKDFIKLQHDYHVYSEDYHGEVPVLQLSLQKQINKVFNEQTGKEEVRETVKLTNAFASVKKDTIELHHMQKVVGENRIEFYKNHPELAERDGVTSEILHEANSMVESGDHHNLNEKEINSHMNDHSLSDSKKSNLKKAKELLNPSFEADEIVFRVQVAAYRNPKNYHWLQKDAFGDVLEVSYPDGITRFTIGGTKHLKEAQRLQHKLVEKGIKDAFVVAYRGKQRITIDEALKK